jgi:hypothetical protein
MNRQLTDPAAVDAEVDRIRSLGIDALRARWRLMFGGPAPKGLTKDIIRRMITNRIQEDAIGGLDRETTKLLDRLARGEKTGAELNRRVKAGTVLIREYRGKQHTVTVVPEGFLWEGATYSSLSTIARAITGTAWNGPRFFGLRPVVAKQIDESSAASAGARKPRRRGHPWNPLQRSSAGRS